MWTQSPTAKAKISAARKGTKRKQETIDKIKAARAFQSPPNLKHGKYVTANQETCNSVFRRFAGLLKVPVKEQVIFRKKLERTYSKNSKNGKRSDQIPYSYIYNLNIRDLLCTIQPTEFGQTFWVKSLEKCTNLDFSLNDVSSLQSSTASTISKNIKSSNPLQRLKYNRSVEKIAKLYTDSAKRLVGGRAVRLFSPYQPIHKQKNFLKLLKLKCVFEILGLKTDADRRQYILAVFDRKQRQKQHQFIPLATLASPLCVLDYLFYMRDVYYARYTSAGMDNDANVREELYGGDYYKEQMEYALGICQQLVDMKWESRLASEVPHAFGEEEFCLFYAVCSPYIRKLQKLGVLEQGWPEFHKALYKFRERLGHEQDLLEAVLQTRRYIDEMWKESGIPGHSSNPVEDIRGIIEHMCPQSMRGVEGWLERKSRR